MFNQTVENDHSWLVGGGGGQLRVAVSVVCREHASFLNPAVMGFKMAEPVGPTVATRFYRLPAKITEDASRRRGVGGGGVENSRWVFD